MESNESQGKRFPIAETFRSPKGEGLYLGTLMHFIRFAGCSVGKIAFEKGNCATWDHRRFDCDTDFSRYRWMTPREIAAECAGVEPVVLTGGEPLDHDLSDLIPLLQRAGHRIHLETSGTRPLPRDYTIDWIACSPKAQIRDEYWEAAHELKFLIDHNFDRQTEARLIQFIEEHQPKGLLYLQPVNYIRGINDDNAQRALAIQKRYPRFRIALQAHKMLGVR